MSGVAHLALRELRRSVLAISVLPLACSSQELPDEPTRRVLAHFERLEAADAFSGALLVARGDEILIRRGFGLADRELDVTVEPDHVFRIGSLTKPVTASAVLVAVDRGRMALEDSVCTFLDPCPRPWAAVTVEHALTHTSGVEDHFGDLEAVPVEQTAVEVSRVLREIGDEPLRGEPGAEYAYSNFNYVLLGLALEQAYGEPWEAVLRRLLFDPLGLESMGYDDVWAIVPGRLHGYDRDEAGRTVRIEYDDHAAYAAGGLRSTIGDFFRWSRALIAGDLIGEELRRRAFTPYRDLYGYGWQVRSFFARDVYNHTGGIDGFSTAITHYPDQELSVLVFSNVAADSAVLRACQAAWLWFGRTEPPATLEQWAALSPRETCGVESSR